MATVGEEQVTTHEAASPKFRIKHIDSNAPRHWLEQGIADLKVKPMVSLAYSAVYVFIGLVLLWMTWETPIYITTLASGFLMIGPIVSVVFYRISRRIEQGRKPELDQGWNAWHFNSVSLISFALVLGTLMALWAVFASVAVALFTSGNIVMQDGFFATIFNHENAVGFVLTYFISGGILAAFAFSISVVSVPLLTDKNVDFVTAMITSLQAVRENVTPMVAWAFIIATLMFLGSIFFFVGLIIALPIIGHASWHAYRDLIEEV